MNNISKKVTNYLLVLVMCFTFATPTFAASNSSHYIDQRQIISLNDRISDTTSVNFLKISDSEVIYTYEENGETYKNVDTMISSNQVNTEVYVLKSNTYIHIDTITSVVEGTTITARSISNGQTTYDLSITAAAAPNWKYQSSYNGNTSFRNQSITAIAIGLGALIGGGSGAFMAVAAYIFDKNIKTVYYHVKVYKDTNSSTLRPTFKKISYFYKDAAHKNAIPGNPVTSIVKP